MMLQQFSGESSYLKVRLDQLDKKKGGRITITKQCWQRESIKRIK
jgi:hypothetical protein